jgi:predicted PurR-regulated permease PerM
VWGILLLTLPVVGVVALLLFVAIPAAVGQIGEVTQRAPVFFERVAGWLDAARHRLLLIDVPFLDEEKLVARLRDIDSATVVTFLQERSEALGQYVWQAVTGVGRGLGAIFGVLGYVVLTPVLTFYLLKDWDRMRAAASRLIPRDRRETATELAGEYDHLLGRYLRGQITVAVTIGAVTALGLWIVRFPYAGTLGLIVAVFSVVPYLGLVLSLLPAVFIALVSGSVGVSLLKVAVVYGAAQMLEGAVVSPRIVGDSVGLHPVLVVLALAVGGFFFGFVGLLLAVPGAVGIKLLVERGMEHYRSSDFYRGEAAP